MIWFLSGDFSDGPDAHKPHNDGRTRCPQLGSLGSVASRTSYIRDHVMKNKMADDNKPVEEIADWFGWERRSSAFYLSDPAVSVSAGIGNMSGIWVRSLVGVFIFGVR